MDYIETIRELAEITAPSGFEKAVTDRLAELCKPYASEITLDPLGTLLVHKKGSGKKTLLTAACDTSGFIATYIDDDGFVRVGELGKCIPSACVGLPVRFQNGTRGVIGCDGGVEVKDLRARHLYIDTMGETVRVGDACAADLPTYASGDSIVSPAMNRACCAVLLDVLQRYTGDGDVTFAFTAQGMLGGRGASPAAYAADAARAIAVELTTAGDTPESESRSKVKLGEGPVLPVSVGGTAANLGLIAELEACGVTRRAVDERGQSALLGLQGVRAGVRACVAGIAARYSGVMTIARVSDMQQTAELLLAAL